MKVYSKPQVTIDLAEYEDLLELQEQKYITTDSAAAKIQNALSEFVVRMRSLNIQIVDNPRNLIINDLQRSFKEQKIMLVINEDLKTGAVNVLLNFQP